MSRFVTPRTRTLTLANGDQLIVRERLTVALAVEMERPRASRCMALLPVQKLWRFIGSREWPRAAVG